MSSASYASIVNASSPCLTPATADTSLTAPTHTGVFWTSPAAGGARSGGSRVDQIRINQVATTGAAGFLNIFRKSGGAYFLFASYAYNALAISPTVQLAPQDFTYTLGRILAAGDTLECTVTTAAGQQAFSVEVVSGGDFSV